MQQGSQGPHVALLQAFLAGARLGAGLVPDREYGRVTAEAVAKLQARMGVANDGHFGPQTQEVVKRLYGFDFKDFCESMPGTTLFLQPNRAKVLWSSPAVLGPPELLKGGAGI